MPLHSLNESETLKGGETKQTQKQQRIIWWTVSSCIFHRKG